MTIQWCSNPWSICKKNFVLEENHALVKYWSLQELETLSTMHLCICVLGGNWERSIALQNYRMKHDRFLKRVMHYSIKCEAILEGSD